VTVVRVPASTANLGPGFDALGMALSVTAEIGVVDDSTPADGLARVVDEHNPATVAFTAAGGTGTLWVRSPIPMGRGMGYSGAMRVGGAALASASRSSDGAAAVAADHALILAVAAQLEGHADNVAASLYGGVVATDGERVVRLETPLEPDVVLWIPPSTTLTAASRTSLPDEVAFADAAFNVGRTALLVAALATGDVSSLRAATEDRLHQAVRLAASPHSDAALAAGLAAGAWCGWLSGSGPTVAFLAEPGSGEDIAARIAARLPDEGHAKVVAIDRSGVRCLGTPSDSERG
jgi:homoserine kinase